MAEMLIQSESLTSIADKIRVLKDISQSMSLDDMEAQLDIPKNDSSDLTASGATVTVPAGYYASQATKSVATTTQATPSVSIDSAGKITATATQTAGYVSAGTKSGTKQLTVQAAKTVTPSTSEQTAVASGVYTTGAVKVAAIPTVTRANTTISVSADDTNDKLTITASNNQGTGYVTGANKTATKTITLTASGSSVTASDGTNKVSKSVATATQATPSISINSSGLITASATQTAGYVSAGTKSGTKQLTTQAAKTITPSTSSQTAVASGVYTTGAVTVAAIPSTYVKPSYTKDATTYTPSTTNQTIESGTYLTGVQTIKGDANLVASNIKKGSSIFGVSGSFEGVELNFEIVGGTSRPSNPTENTIWVNTNIHITGYKFSATEPENMVEGEVWIKTGDDSNVAFDIVEDVKLCPLCVKQYVDGALVDKTAMSYLNSEWTDWRIYIYNAGDDGNALYVYTPSGSYTGPLSTVFDNDGISLKSTSSSGTYGVRIGTNNTIDFTNYSKLYAKVIFYSIGSGGKNIWNALAVATDRSGQNSNYLASVDYSNPSVGEHVYEVDISNINTSGYVEYSMDAYRKTVYAKITGIWLKY